MNLKLLLLYLQLNLLVQLHLLGLQLLSKLCRLSHTRKSLEHFVICQKSLIVLLLARVHSSIDILNPSCLIYSYLLRLPHDLKLLLLSSILLSHLLLEQLLLYLLLGSELGVGHLLGLLLLLVQLIQLRKKLFLSHGSVLLLVHPLDVVLDLLVCCHSILILLRLDLLESQILHLNKLLLIRVACSLHLIVHIILVITFIINI